MKKEDKKQRMRELVTQLEELAQVRHTKPMLSADKTKSMDDLLQFCERNCFAGKNV